MTFWAFANEHPFAVGFVAFIALIVLDSMIANIAIAFRGRK